MNALDYVVAQQTNGGARIGTARDHVGMVRAGASLSAWFSSQAQARGLKFDTMPAAIKVNAEVNHGRWIVKCPFCAGAEDADYRDPVFFCLSCGNHRAGEHIIEVVFPKDRELVEAVLLRRGIENRNWKRDELVGDLVVENAKHGIKI